MALDLGERVSRAPRRAFKGDGYRQPSPRYEPLSGEGARLRGGRFNPPNSFSVLYLCTTRACAVAEFRRFADRHPIGAEAFLPRVLFRYEIELASLLDLTDGDVLSQLDIEPASLLDDDWTLTQEIGELAHQFGFQGVVNTSATRVDDVLALFPDNLRSGRITPNVADQWQELSDLE
jgi:RES domain-containing protein